MTIIHAGVYMRRNDIDLGRLIKKFWSTVRYPDSRLLVCNLRNKILGFLKCISIFFFVCSNNQNRFGCSRYFKSTRSYGQ